MKSSLLVEILLVTSLLAAAGPTHASPTSGGPTRLTIDGSAAGFCSHDTNSCTVTVTTSQNHDILIAYTEESLDLQTSCTFSVSDTAGLSWAPRSPIVFGRYENGGYRDQIQEWWAKSIGILNSDMITESIFGCASGYGGEYNGLQVFGISGTNFNNPFDPNSSLPGSGSDSISGQSSVATAIISTSDPNDMLFAGFQPGAVVVATPQSGFATITGFGSEYEVTNGTVTNSTVTFSMSSISYWEIIADAVVAGG